MHTEPKPKAKPKAAPRKPAVRRCKICNEPGHIAKTCPFNEDKPEVFQKCGHIKNFENIILNKDGHGVERERCRTCHRANAAKAQRKRRSGA